MVDFLISCMLMTIGWECEDLLGECIGEKSALVEKMGELSVGEQG